MPTLTTTQKASIQATHETDHDQQVDLYRPPAMSAGKRGDATLVTANLPCSRTWPIGRAPKVLAALPELAGIRVEAFRFFALTATVQAGDELRSGSTKQKVEGVGTWQNVKVAALSEVKP